MADKETPVEPEQEPYLATENFAYNASSKLDSLAGGEGWADVWHGGNASIDAKSLGYPGHSGSGGSLILPAGADLQTTWSRVVGPISRCKIDPSKGGHIYFSAILRCAGMGKGAELRINPLDPQNKTTQFNIIVAEANGKIRLSLSSNPRRFTEIITPDPIFLLMCLDFSAPKLPAGEVKLTLWVNQSLSESKLDWKKAKLVGVVKPPGLPDPFGLFLQKKTNPGEFGMDEIRYGYHQADMLFKPKTQAAEPEENLGNGG